MGNWFTNLFDIDNINAKTEQANKTLVNVNNALDNAKSTINTAKGINRTIGGSLLDLMLYGENDETAHFYKPDNKRLLLIIILSLLIVIVLILIYYADDFIKYHENKSDNIYL